MAICQKTVRPAVLRPKDACTYLGVSYQQLRALRDQGLPYFTYGNAIRYLRSDLEQWLKDYLVGCSTRSTTQS